MRSPTMRVLLEDEPAAAARFTTSAFMSGYAYHEEEDCGHPHKLSREEADRFEQRLAKTGWQRARGAEFIPPCEDDTGLFYHVWARELPEAREVVIAFRGTWGFRDWWYGNLYWVRRLFTDNHQYARARDHATRIVQHFEQRRGGKALRFFSTGHSLGGGLAQGVLYDRPKTFIQAVAFAPSSATAYTTRSDTSPLTPCLCSGDTLEPRIFRVYESSEILANLRIFHKLFFQPEPWINEVRFNYDKDGGSVSQHSMANLAAKLAEKQDSSPPEKHTKPWYTAKEGCTARFSKSLEESCAQVCPVPASGKPDATRLP